MAHAFASEQWIDELWGELRTDERFRRAAASWVHGPMLLVIEADADKQFPETTRILLDVHEGGARKLSLDPERDAALTPFVMSAGYLRWKAVLAGKLDLVEAIYQGLVRFRGDLPTVARHADMIAALVAIAQRVDTAFPDEQPVAEPAAAGSR